MMRCGSCDAMSATARVPQVHHDMMWAMVTSALYDAYERPQMHRPKKKAVEKTRNKESEGKKQSERGSAEERAAREERRKKDRVAYEHVGRMDVRATVVEIADEKEKDKGAMPKNGGSKAPTPRGTASKVAKDGQVIM